MVSTETITEGTEENSVGTDEEPAHELCDLWVRLVTRWRTIPRALAACDLSHLQQFGESDLAALWRQAFGPTRDVPTRFLGSLVSTCEALPRSQLLQAFAFCAPRVTFREWSNAVLLAYERLADLALTLRSGGKRFPRPDQDIVMKELPSPALLLRGSDFAEALSMQEIPSTDALQWLDAVRASGERSKCGLDFDLLSRRIIDQKVPQLRSLSTRSQQGLPLEDIAVRLIHSFGDLTSAFNLLPKASQVNQTQPRSAAANRSLSPEFFGPARLPGASKARATDLGGHVARNATREAKAEGDVYALTERQWLHALRGSSHCRLLPEAEARMEANRQVENQGRRTVEATLSGSLQPALRELTSLFPNLTERLCVAKTSFHPYEAMVVRASTLPYGFFGHRLARRATASAVHFTAPRNANEALGAAPFLAVVPLGLERSLVEGVEIESRALLEPASRTFAAALVRAPGRRAPGASGLWALQLCASEDGLRALSTVGPPLSFRVHTRTPSPPSAPYLTATGLSESGCFIIVNWHEPLDSGGSPIIAHDLKLWEREKYVQGEEPLAVFSGDEVFPEYHLEGVSLGTDYVLQVRCHNEAGASEWSALSEALRTPEPRPKDLGPPEAVEAGLEFATLRWTSSTIDVECYEILVEPQSSSEPSWVSTVEAPAEEPGPTESGSEQTEATIAGLRPRQLYCFRVRGRGKSEPGPWSMRSELVYTAARNPQVATAPTAPVQAERMRDGMVLVWNAPANEGEAPVVRYVVQGRKLGSKAEPGSSKHQPSGRKRVKKPPPNRQPGEEASTEQLEDFLQFQTADASTRLTLQGLQGNARYVFQVFALSAGGLSAPSPLSAPLTTAAVAPRRPKCLTVSLALQKEVTLRWEPSPDDGGQPIEKYTLEVINGSEPADRQVKEFEPHCTEGLVDGLSGNTRYFFRLCATSALGASPAAELLVRSGPVPPGLPGMPRLLNEPTATSATLAWSAPADNGGGAILGYSLEGTGIGDDCAYYALDVTAKKGKVEGLLPDRRYRFRVCARNAAGVGPHSEWSAAVRTAPAPPMEPPKPRATAASARTIQVTWGEALLAEAATHPRYWEVAVFKAAKEPHPGTEECILRAKSPPLAVKALERYTQYVFRVRAFGFGGWSSWSSASEPIATSEEWTNEEIVDALLPKFGGTLANIFRNFDANCDGFMTFDDLIHGLADAGMSDLSEHRIRRLFSDLDGGTKGRVSLRQFSKCLSPAAATAPSRVGSPLAAPHMRRSPSPPMPGARSTKVGSSGRLVRSPSPPSPRLARAQKPSFELTYQSPSARPNFAGPL